MSSNNAKPIVVKGMLKRTEENGECCSHEISEALLRGGQHWPYGQHRPSWLQFSVFSSSSLWVYPLFSLSVYRSPRTIYLGQKFSAYVSVINKSNVEMKDMVVQVFRMITTSFIYPYGLGWIEEQHSTIHPSWRAIILSEERRGRCTCSDFNLDF